MVKKDLPDINTAKYWDELYLKGGERVGSWKNIKPFLDYEIENKLKNTDETISMIDVGGYTGYSVRQAKNDFPKLEAWNLDISPVAVEDGKRLHPEIKQVLFDINKDVSPLNFEGKFDFILMQDVMEHLPEPIEMLGKLYKWLKKDGILWVNSPHDEGDWGSKEHLFKEFNHDDVHSFWEVCPEICMCNFKNYNEELQVAFKIRKR